MNILITAATDGELALLRQQLACVNNVAIVNGNTVQLAVTGVGITATTYALTKLLHKNKFDWVINMGIAGSFSANLTIGDTVVVKHEIFADWGVRTPNGFATVFEAEIVAQHTSPFKTNGWLYCAYIEQFLFLNNFYHAKALTVNTVNGNEHDIEAVHAKFTPDIESMEGAAFFYVCLQENVPFIELRGISNKVEKRDKSRWNIPLAIGNVSQVVVDFIKQIG